MTTTATPVLGTEDRCDRCGAQAYVLVRLRTGQDLQFCVHHYTAHAAALEPLTSEVVDESSRLFEASGR